jgi:hypothetical protein
MKNIIILLLICLFSSIQAAEWETISRTSTVDRNRVVGVDFSTSAKEIKYSVTCSSTCDILLITEDNFRRLTSGSSYTALRELKEVTRDSASWTNRNDIQRRLIVAVVNKYSPSVTANYELQQLVEKPTLGGTILALIILGPIICCCVVVLSIVGLVWKFVTNPLGCILDALFPNRYHYHGTRSSIGHSSGGNFYYGGSSGGSSGGNTFSGSL